MRKYSVQLSDGSMANMSYIGLNRTIDGKIYNNVISSYNKMFDNEDLIIVSNDNKGIRLTTIGNIVGAHQLLRNELISKEPRNAEGYMECVQQAVNFYFGAYSNRNERVFLYPTEEEVEKKGEKRGRISDLGKKENYNVATSLERAVVAQNLLSTCCVDIEIYFKISATLINDKERAHAYNLVRDKEENKCYLCDFSIPSMRKGKVSPIICEIPYEVYEKMISPVGDIGYSVEVNYRNTINAKDYLITYDAGRDEIYQVDKALVKKKV